MTMFVTEKRSILILLTQLEKNDSLTDAIKAFFQPFCDHNIVDWIKARILANDTAVIDKIAELIQAPVSTIIAHPANKFPVGYFQSTWCQGSVRMANIIGPDGTTSQTVTVSTNDPSCF